MHLLDYMCIRACIHVHVYCVWIIYANFTSHPMCYKYMLKYCKSSTVIIAHLHVHRYVNCIPVSTKCKVHQANHSYTGSGYLSIAFCWQSRGILLIAECISTRLFSQHSHTCMPCHELRVSHVVLSNPVINAGIHCFRGRLYMLNPT